MGFLDGWKNRAKDVAKAVKDDVTGQAGIDRKKRNMEEFDARMNAQNEGLRETVDRHSPEITKALDEGKIYRKVGEIKAEVATEATKVRTIIAGGKETDNTAEPGDYIVTNLWSPSRERYMIKAQQFPDLYDLKEGETDVYKPKAYVRAGRNPYGKGIRMMAQWGDMQNGDEDCMLADTYDQKTGKREGEPRIVARSAFETTYELVEG